MGRHPGFTVGKDHQRWVVNVAPSVSPTGKRQRLPFKTKRAAQAHADQLIIDQANKGREAQTMPYAQRADAHRAMAILEPHGATLEEAAEFYSAWREELAHSVTFPELVDSYTERKRRQGKHSDREQQTYSQIRTRYTAEFGERVAAELTKAHVEAALDSQTDTAASFNAHRRYLSALFNHGVREGWAQRNVAALVDPRKTTKERPVVLTVKQARELMKAAQNHEEGSMVQFFGVCLFAGLRPAREAAELEWEDIDLEAGMIYVRPSTAKTSVDRYVTISDNLKGWLEPHQSEGPILPNKYGGRKFREDYDIIREDAGIKGLWSKTQRDILRHSWASYHYGQHKSVDQLLEQAGHGLSTNLKHYRRAVMPADAAEFWGLYPK